MAVEAVGSCAGLRACLIELRLEARLSWSLGLNLRLNCNRRLVLVSERCREDQDLTLDLLWSGEAVGLIFLRISEIDLWRLEMRLRLSGGLCSLRRPELGLETLGLAPSGEEHFSPLGASKAQLPSGLNWLIVGTVWYPQGEATDLTKPCHL